MKPPKVTDNPPPVLKEDELARLLATCDKGNDFESRRDAALLQVFIDTGARLAEVVGLTVEDVDLDTALYTSWAKDVGRASYLSGNGRHEPWIGISASGRRTGQLT